MLFRKNNEWLLSPYKVTYTQYDKEEKSYTHDKQWWLDFAEQWSHTTIISIDDATYTNEQIERCNHIKYLPEDFGHLYSHYVEFGEILEDVELMPQHPFNIVILKHKELVRVTTKAEQVAETLDMVLTDLIPTLLGGE